MPCVHASRSSAWQEAQVAVARASSDGVVRGGAQRVLEHDQCARVGDGSGMPPQQLELAVAERAARVLLRAGGQRAGGGQRHAAEQAAERHGWSPNLASRLRTWCRLRPSRRPASL
jgi:hypothetical protein